MDEPADDIMRATYCALCEHGYADLTMRDIAERSDRSKAALHYHYDSKHGLLVAFLEYLFERFTARVDPAVEGSGDPDERLRAFVEAVLHPRREDSAREFHTALLEIKAQAPYDEAFRERLVAFDDHVFATVRSLVVEGVETGVYRETVDPDAVARFVTTMVDGTHSRRVVLGDDADDVRATLEAFLDAHLLPEREVST